MSSKADTKYKLLGQSDEEHEHEDHKVVENVTDDEDDDFDEDNILFRPEKKLDGMSIDDDIISKINEIKKNSKSGRFVDCCYRYRYCCFSLWALITFLVCTFFVIRTSLNYDEIKDYVLTTLNINRVSSEDWTVEMPTYGTESCIRLFDIDEDGLDDIIFGLATVTDINVMPSANSANVNTNNDNDNRIVCGQDEVNADCQGIMYGIRGYDGKILWKFTTKSEVFEINCNSIDIDLDGKNDCLASGRRKTLIAFNPRTGKIFWESHSNFLKENWNIYNPVILPIDIDNDGVKEVVIAHGGNPTIPSHVKERESGRIMLYSGKTGNVMGKFLPMPNEKETYMSPVLHTMKDGSLYLLLGSGGETVPGAFYAISLPNFYNYVSTYLLDKKPKFPGTYNADYVLKALYKEHPSIKGLFNLFESPSKGVMVPPVLCDVNNDGTKDILMSCFDGTLILYNGETFEHIWRRDYACHETYTSPAPGYFNDDDVPDFMLAQNYGAFDFYRYSVFDILDGKDGSLLWEMKSPRMQMVSPLTIRTTEQSPKRDLFFFRIQGAEVYNITTQSSHQVYHGLEPQQPVDRPMKRSSRRENILKKAIEKTTDQDICPKYETFVNEAENDESFKPKCENKKSNDEYLSTYGLVFDRTTAHNPLLVFESKPTSVVYSYTLEDVSPDSNKRNAASEKGDYGSTCVVLEPMERNTGAIGDLDGDGIPDIATIISRGGIVKDKKGGYLKILTEMFLTKKSLGGVLKRSETLKNTDKTITTKIEKHHDETKINKLNYEKNQSWTAYMGYYSDSAYTN